MQNKTIEKNKWKWNLKILLEKFANLFAYDNLNPVSYDLTMKELVDSCNI